MGTALGGLIKISVVKGKVPCTARCEYLSFDDKVGRHSVTLVYIVVKKVIV